MSTELSHLKRTSSEGTTNLYQTRTGPKIITQAGKRKHMAKVRLHPLFEQIRGKIKGLVFRLSHNGKISVYMDPDMSRVKWSPAQIAHRERFAEARAYAKAALAVPEIRTIYMLRSLELKNNNRPHDMAVSDYLNGNNLLGDKFDWDVEWWREMQKYKRPKRR